MNEARSGAMLPLALESVTGTGESTTSRSSRLRKLNTRSYKLKERCGQSHSGSRIEVYAHSEHETAPDNAAE